MKPTTGEFLTPAVRYPCCDHCAGEGCPRMSGHALPCGVRDCYSNTPIMEQDTHQVTNSDHAMEEIMGWREEENLRTAKEDLIDAVETLVGFEPEGLRNMLRVLTHPLIIPETKAYLELMDDSTKCLKYEAPWNCAREAEAKYQNIQHGWVGGAGIGFDESWCEPCRKKVMGT